MPISKPIEDFVLYFVKFQTLNFQFCTQHKSQILSEKVGSM